MGLTIHYTLRLAEALPDRDARALLARARAYALELDAADVTKISRWEPDFFLAHRYLFLKSRDKQETRCATVPHLSGYGFRIQPGADCEPAAIGLCRYPATVLHEGRELRTKLGAGWLFSSFCKTQYASLHGWDHFLKCHRTVLAMLRFCRKLGMKVKVSDEGDYWRTRSEAVLRAKLDQLNGIMAAAAGFLKDELQTPPDSKPVVAPILRHPRFERLEHEGQQDAGPFIDALRRAMENIE